MSSSLLLLYCKNVLISIDQFFNTLFGGSPDETISSRVFRYKDSNMVAKITYKVLNWIQPNHCEDSLEPEDHHKEDILK